MKDYIKENKILLGIIILALVFHKSIEELYIKLIIPILEIPTQGILLDIIFFIGFVFCLIIIIRKIYRGYKYTCTHITISVLFLIGYLYYRLNNIYDFKSLQTVDPIKYLDLVALYFAIPLFIFIKSCCVSCAKNLFKIIYRIISKKKNETLTYKGFNSDNPIDSNGIDLLKRKKNAKIIAEKIVNTISEESSFAIGITGEWGSGKTSFFNLIKDNLKDKDIIKIDFNPWLNHGAQFITKDFFRTISSALRPYHSSLSNDFNKYAQALIQINNSSLNNFIKPINKLLTSEKSAKEEFDLIKSTLKSLDFKLVIFIDDIDRLYTDEIFEVLRIIRNTANFPNTFFIVGYDREYLELALEKMNNYNTVRYFEKIFQVEFNLPNFEKRVLQEKLYKLVEPQLNEEDKEEFKNFVFNEKGFLKPDLDLSHTNTLRDITRIANSFIIAYEALKGLVLLSDLFNLELLKMKYPNVYKVLVGDIKKYLSSSNDIHGQSRMFIAKQADSKAINLKIDLQKLGMDENNISKSIQLLNSLFPSLDTFSINNLTEENNLTISNPSSFERYIHYRLLESDLSEIEFKNARNGTCDEFLAKVKEWIDKGLRKQLIARLELIVYYDNKDDYEKIIKGIFLINSTPKINEDDFHIYEMSKLLNNIGSYAPDEQMQVFYPIIDDYIKFIKSIFDNASFPYIPESEFLYRIRKDSQYDYNFIIDEKTNDELRVNFLKKYLDETKELSRLSLDLLTYCNSFEKITNNENLSRWQEKRNTEAVELYLEKVRKGYLKDFLKQIIYRDTLNAKKEKYRINGYAKLFPDLNKLGDFLDEFKDKGNLDLEEFLPFYDKCKETKFTTSVDYHFDRLK